MINCLFSLLLPSPSSPLPPPLSLLPSPSSPLPPPSFTLLPSPLPSFTLLPSPSSLPPLPLSLLLSPSSPPPLPPPLSLLVSPQFTVVPSPTSIQEGRVLSLPCAAYGHPDPDILWFKDDQQLINPLLDPGTQSLQLYNTTPGDTGAYTCLARNFAGVIQYSVAVTIEEVSGMCQVTCHMTVM